MKIKTFLLVFFIFASNFHYCIINANDTLILDNKYHVDFVITENGIYRHCIIDSVFYFDSEKNTYIKFNNIRYNFGGISFSNKDSYLKFMNSDTIILCHQYEDIKNNIITKDDIKIEKPYCHIASSFLIEIEGEFLKKRKGLYLLTHRFLGCGFGVYGEARIIDVKKRKKTNR